MPTIQYWDFDLYVARHADGYEARVLRSPAGQARHQFSLDIPSGPLRRLGRAAQRTEESVRTIGALLYAAVFDSEVGRVFERSRDLAFASGIGLRIRLHLNDAPELSHIPWEYLYSPSDRRWLLRSAGTPIVRYLDLAEPVPPLTVTPPLRMLVVIAQPSDAFDQLAVEAEWKAVADALGPLERRGLLTLDRLDRGTIDALQTAIRREDYHIVHFVGHGRSGEQGELIFERPDGTAHPVLADRVASIITDHRTVRLVVLNACEGARLFEEDLWGGTAQTLIGHGVPAVVAMQSLISDQASLAFSGQFYEAVCDGYPIDAAVGEGRKSMAAHGLDRIEWGTPVLYTRAEDGVVFQLDRTPVHRRHHRTRGGLGDEEWHSLLRRMEYGRLTPIVGWGAVSPPLPSRETLAASWAEEMGLEAVPKPDVPTVSQYMSIVRHHLYPKEEMAAVAAGRVRSIDGPLESLRRIADLPVSTFLTTNFDDLLERTLVDLGKRPVKAHCAWHLPAPGMRTIDAEPDERSPLLYHLLGHHSDPASLVVTEDDHLDYIVRVARNPDVFPPKVQEALSGASLVLLGYRLDDWMFRVLVRGLLAASVTGGRGFSIAVQLPPELEPDREFLERHLGALFRASDHNRLHVFWGSIDDFLTELSERWDIHRAESAVR